jgi:putative hemolysin
MALAVLSALLSAVLTIRGGVTASADVQSESPEVIESARLRRERLIIAIRLAWAAIFASLVLQVPRIVLEGVLGSASEAPPALWAASTAVTIFAVLLVGELIPAAFAARRPEEAATLLARPVSLALRIFGPVPRLIQRGLHRVVRVDRNGEGQISATGEEDIRHLVDEVEEAGEIEEGERRIINRVFSLGDKPVASVMTPRADVVKLLRSEPLDALVERALPSGFSTFPVMAAGGEEVCGTVKLHELVSLARNGSLVAIDSILREPFQAPESMSALQLLELFRERGDHFAIVVDEYGSFAGIATISDVLEVLVGDIGPAGAAKRIVKRHDGSLLVDSAIDIDQLFEELGVKEHGEGASGEFRSLGGFVMTVLGRVPTDGESFEAAGYRFEVVDMDGKRIDKVLVSAVIAQRAVGE